MKPGLIVFFALVTSLLHGQEFHFRQAPPLTEGEVRKINILFQTADQMVWLGTDKGVYSFDGRKYSYTGRPDHQRASVSAISEDQLGHIWAGYEDGYLHMATLQGYNQAIPTDSLKGALISRILFSKANEVCIATYGKGVWMMTDGKLSRIRMQELAETDDIYDAVYDRKGRLWLATDNGIWIYQREPVVHLSHLDRQDGLPDEIVTQLEVADNGDIWIGLYDHRLAYYQFDQDSVLAVSAHATVAGNVIGISKGVRDEIWVGSEKSIDIYSLQGNGRKVKMPVEMKDRLESFLLDLNGNLWMASGNRLFITNTRLEFSQPAVEGLQALAVTKDKVWIGSDKGLYAMNLSDRKVTAHLEHEHINILSLYTDPTGLLWIGTFGQGLYCFDPVTERYLHLTEKNKLSNNSILNIDGRDNYIWLATLGGIMELEWKGNPLKDDITITSFLEKYQFPEGYVYDVYAAADGKTWFGTDGKGLYCLDKNHFFPVVLPVDTTAGEDADIRTIYSITADDAANVWIAGSKGLIMSLGKSGKSEHQYKDAYGMVNSLISSGNGEILMIREGGLQVVDRHDDILIYNESAGLKAFTPNINAAALDRDGTVWIADANRLIHYIPFWQDSPQIVRIHLESILPVSLFDGDKVRLQPDSNFLDIRFTGLWYQDPENIRYRYMLEGHDQDWIYTREGRAVYSRLSPGDYTIIIQGSYNDSFSDTHAYRKSFTVLTPFYLRWWFVLGILLLISFAILSYILARIKRIQQLHQLEKEKTMLRLHAIQAQVNPHFLFNSFNTLSGIIEEDQHAAVDYVDQLSGFFRGVLMHRNAELIRVEEELEIVRNYMYILRKRYGCNLLIVEDIRQSAGWIAPLSIQLLVENAIKHNIVSTEKPLTITILVDHKAVTVSNPIQPKVNLSTDSTGFGLSSLVARYHYLTQEKVEIRTEQNTFTVRIPIIYSDKPI